MTPLGRAAMTPISELSNIELRTAIATESDGGWVNVQRDSAGRLMGIAADGFVFAPEQIPNWPGEIEEAMRLERSLAANGLTDPYVHYLVAITQADSSPEGMFRLASATARQRTEAALLVLRRAAPLT